MTVPHTVLMAGTIRTGLYRLPHTTARPHTNTVLTGIVAAAHNTHLPYLISTVSNAIVTQHATLTDMLLPASSLAGAGVTVTPAGTPGMPELV